VHYRRYGYLGGIPRLAGVSRFRAFAHRGGSHEAPENSLRAFQNAQRLGFVEMETDIRGTRDGVAVVHHDASLDRTTDGVGLLKDVTWAEVSRARIHGHEPILRLEELLEAMPESRFTLDAKDEVAVPALLNALERTGEHSRVCVGAFSHRRLSQVRRSVRVTTSASPREVFRFVAAVAAGRQASLSADYLQIPPNIGRRRLVDERLVSAAHAAGHEVHVWTIDSPAQMHELLDLGVDGIMTDRPRVLREVLQQRGLWT
jgi:glycerophosphoryl diester phosphodiesterase